jgi:D-beta-D-heptose 7-phosphate kinase/D-beta-D-heptose 1-phosphate adenosyltransferase
LARRSDVPLLVDPACDVNYRRYGGATCIKPNRLEAGTALGRRIRTPKEGLEAARDLLRFDVETALVTLDRDGIAWADALGRSRLFPIQPRQVFDITGAGDMVLGALGYALAAGADWPTAIDLANLAAGMEVERLGAASLTRHELLAGLASRDFSMKIVSTEQLVDRLRRRRLAGEKIVMTNGCFDLLHPGHTASLQDARNQGHCLVVGLNSDRSVEALKGAGHPIIDQQGRAEMLAAIGCVDYVVIFDDVSVEGLVEQVQPDVLVKSAEYATDEVVGHEIVHRRGGSVALTPRKGDYSTSRLIDKIQNMDEREAARKQ